VTNGIQKPTDAQIKLSQKVQEIAKKNSIPVTEAVELVRRKQWEKLPVAAKVRKIKSTLEAQANGLIKFVSSVTQDIRMLSSMIKSMNYNIRQVADSIDVNYISYRMIFEKLGITVEEQAEFLTKAQEEFNLEVERKKKEAEQKKKEAEDEAERARVEAELAAASSLVDEEAAEEIPEEGAQVFGGDV